MSGEQKAGESKVQIPQLTPAGKEALAKGKTTRLISSGVSPPRFTLRQRGYWPDEQAAEAGDALHRARTSGVLGQVKEHGEKRKEVTPFIKAIGRRNRDAMPSGARMGVKKGKETIPTFLAERIKQLSKDPISDLTKTSLAAESQRKATGIKGDKPRKKNPQSAGKRRKKRRKTKRKRRKKTKKSRRRRKKRTRRRKR